MEQDATVLEVAPKTRTTQGHTCSSRASHGGSTFTDLTPQEMDTMTHVLHRLDSKDIQIYEIQGLLTYIIS